MPAKTNFFFWGGGGGGGFTTREKEVLARVLESGNKSKGNHTFFRDNKASI